MSPTPPGERAIALTKLVQQLQGKTLGDDSESLTDASKRPYIPASLKWALWIAMGVVVAVTLAGITSLFLVGFDVPWFTLDRIVLASLVGGMSIQSAAAIVSPLAKGIAEVIKEQYKSGKI